MEDKVIFHEGEKVKFLSSYDWENWMIGRIERFTEDGFSPVAIIMSYIDRKPFTHRVPMLNKYIKKIQ